MEVWVSPIQITFCLFIFKKGLHSPECSKEPCVFLETKKNTREREDGLRWSPQEEEQLVLQGRNKGNKHEAGTLANTGIRPPASFVSFGKWSDLFEL